MGDIVHAMPAAAALRANSSSVSWLVEARWKPLLEGAGLADELLILDRGSAGGFAGSLRALRSREYDAAVDLQGLLKSAIPAWLSRSARRFGYDTPWLREKAAGLFYTDRIRVSSSHIVDQHLELARAAGAAAAAPVFSLPPGAPEGSLPEGPFVLASPAAGWKAKQWPLERYEELARLLQEEMDLALVLNTSSEGAGLPGNVAHVHVSGIPGLIHATRRASAVVGVDSGPLHLAAALGVPGVGIYGPTDPQRNGPYGGSIQVLRSPRAVTSYQRHDEIAACMREISARQVMEALRDSLARRAVLSR
jgi:heptosyltransferase-1